MASSILRNWWHAVIQIENNWGGGGTGFLLKKEAEGQATRVFLATNKHVLGEVSTHLPDEVITIRCHIRAPSGETKLARLEVRLTPGRRSVWAGHPDAEVDVAVVELTTLVKYMQSHPEGPSELVHIAVPYELIATPSMLEEHHITPGEDVLIIGFPDISPHIAHLNSEYPFTIDA